MPDLQKKNEFAQFYEKRFSAGYMEEWPDDKKDRVLKLLKSLDLKQSGKALDFGCGNGIFTTILKKALPDWEIYGADISSSAVLNATAQFPECKFYLIDDLSKKEINFDFLFTHHVLEHVFDINDIFKEMTSMMKDNASMLHIAPCGNKGSFEYEICLSIKKGIQTEKGRRFFFEDKGHVRRFTTDSIVQVAANHGLYLVKEYYSNQYYGAIRWMAHSGIKIIFKMTPLLKAKDFSNQLKLIKLRSFLLFLSFTTKRIKSFLLWQTKKEKKLKDFIVMFFSLPFFIFWPVYRLLENKAMHEWENKKNSRNGSEMYLYFIC